jgi:hypothetical protein
MCRPWENNGNENSFYINNVAIVLRLFSGGEEKDGQAWAA